MKQDDASRAPRHDRPASPAQSAAQGAVWGSDAIAETLRALDIPYLALNPGASYRGLHDSLVNRLGNTRPQMLLCLHEESAVALAQGYAKASDRMMGAVLHSNVGLMHGTMAIFNAWCDRMPMLVLGATGPWDAAKRRPWIEWIHTAADQGALVRGYTKWDNQPGSIPAVQEALLRAVQIANTAPRGPVYVNLDSALQETKLDALPPMPEVKRYAVPASARPDDATIAEAARLLSAARHPVILVGRVSRSEAGWRERVALAEKLNARVFTDLKIGAAFPTDHRLHAAPPANMMTADALARLREADVVLSLDWVDLAGTLRQAWGGDAIGARVIQISPDAYIHRGWSMDYQGLPPTDVSVLCEPDMAVPLFLAAVKTRGDAPPPVPAPAMASGDAVSIRAIADALNAASSGTDLCITHLPLGWNGAYRHFRHPLDYIGTEGGGGIGAGPGVTVGAALALKGSGRLPVGILGDGDFLMGVTALWTAVHYKLPCLVIVANNRSFFNDELHQERVAIARGRPVENKWVGQRIDDPDIDLAAMARAQGAEGIGPVKALSELRPAIERGLRIVREGGVCVVDARVLPGYDTGGAQKR